MMGNIFEYFIDKFSQETESVKDSLAEGGIKSYEDYRYYCGVIRGLLVAQSMVAETKHNLEAADDE